MAQLASESTLPWSPESPISPPDTAPSLKNRCRWGGAGSAMSGGRRASRSAGRARARSTWTQVPRSQQRPRWDRGPGRGWRSRRRHCASASMNANAWLVPNSRVEARTRSANHLGAASAGRSSTSSPASSTSTPKPTRKPCLPTNLTRPSPARGRWVGIWEQSDRGPDRRACALRAGFGRFWSGWSGGRGGGVGLSVNGAGYGRDSAGRTACGLSHSGI